MKSSKVAFLLILSTLWFSLTSCGLTMPYQENGSTSVANKTGEETINQEACLQPIFKSSLPLSEKTVLSPEDLENMVSQSPPSIWKKAQEATPIGNSHGELEIITSNDQNLILRFKMQDGSTISYWSYSIEAQMWKEVVSPPKVDHYFFDNDSNLWFIVEGTNELLFYKVDLTENKLEEMLIIEATKLNNRILDFAYSPDHSLWVIMSNQNTFNQILVNLNLITGEVTNHVTLSEYVIGVDVDEKGNVFSLDNKGVVERFNPKAKTVSYTYLSPKSRYWNAGEIKFFFTKTGQVYLNDIAWFENDDYSSNMHLIFRSTVFVTQADDGSGSFVWESPEPQAETEDRRIWYKSMRGLAWHQPETGEWCMFTTAHSNIVKDSGGNLWMVYENDLYMLPASETSKKE